MGKKRSKGYYLKCSSKQARVDHAVVPKTLEVGMHGFLITCNVQESRCVREAYSLLNEYADAHYGPEERDSGGTPSSQECDFEAALQKEVETLKEIKLIERRFQAVGSGAKNCIFIRTTLDDPTQLVHAIMSDAVEKKVQKSRFILRLVPISVICKAYMDDLKKVADDLFEKDFATKLGEGKTFAIMYKSRFNQTLKRTDVIRSLAEIVVEKNPAHKVDLTDPDLAIVVEIIKNLCCVSVLQNYTKFKKYNLSELYGEFRSEPAEHMCTEDEKSIEDETDVDKMLQT